MKILVIFTGGTIGSSTQGRYTSPDCKNNYLLIENYKSKHSENVSFDTASPFSMLSENLSHTQLNGIIKAVSEGLDKDYDGIILTHGTDTLQYTAAALSYCFADIKIPVVLVSSRYPLSHPEQNGDDNFAAAVAFIKAKAGKGVFVAYKNEDCEETKIHYGTRIFSHLEITDAVHSIENQFYASCREDLVTVNPNFKFSQKKCENNLYELCKNSGILVVSSVPGDSYSYNLDGIKAVLLRPYHSGTVNTASTDFRAFCQRAKDLCIPVFIPRAGIETSYASTELFDELGIKYLPCMTFVSAYVKLWLANSIGAGINKFMYEPLNSEFVI